MNPQQTDDAEPTENGQSPASAPGAAEPSRRLVSLGLLTAGAMSAAGGAWWWQRKSRTMPEQTPDRAVLEGPLALEQTLTLAGLSRLDGSAFRYRDLADRPLLINFWATWCPPCVEEMPLLEAFHKENAKSGVQVLAIAADKPEPVGRFMAQHQLTLPVALSGMGVIDLVRKMGNLSGSLPFSVLFDRQRQVVQRKIGKLTSEDLALWRQV